MAKSSRSTVPHPTLTDRDLLYPAMPAEADGFPSRWVVRRVPREKRGDRIETYFCSPDLGLKFRSRPEARRFLLRLAEADGDEAAAARGILPREKYPREEASRGGASEKERASSPPSGRRRKRPRCSVEGCDNCAVAGGLCRKHGPRCSSAGCTHAVY